MKTKNNYRFPTGGVIAVIAAVVIFALSSFYTGLSIISILRYNPDISGGELITRLVSEALSGIPYMSVVFALFGFGCLLIFKQRNLSLLFFPVVGILAYLTSGALVSISYVIQLLDFDRFTAIMRNFFAMIENVLDGGRFALLVNFYRMYVHSVYVAPVLNVAATLIIVVAFALFALVILKNRGEKQGGGKLVILSTVTMAIGYAAILANNILSQSLYVLYLVSMKIKFPTILSETLKLTINEGIVMPIVMLALMVITMVLAGAWIVNPCKKEPVFVEVEETEPSELPVE